MDGNDIIDVGGDHDASFTMGMTLPQTPKMPPDFVPIHPSLRVSPNKLRKEIQELKKKIEEGEDELKTLKNDYNELKADRDLNPKFAEALVHTLTWITHTNETITENKYHLSEAKASLEKSELEAELRNEAILKGYQRYGLVQEGPDSAYVSDTSKFQLMTNWLEAEKVLLLRSPPGSGKTSFAVRFAMYLNDHVSVAYFMNAAWTLQRLDDGASMDGVWKKDFRLSFQEICRRSRDRNIYIIIDEAQAWYPGGMNQKVKTQVETFWSMLKFIKQELNWPVFVTARANGASESQARAESAINVRILLLAGYGERRLGAIATPFEFVDPIDPVTRQRLPLGLNFLRMDREKTYELITKYIDIANEEGKRISFGHDHRIHELIFCDTNGHVGAIRTFLFHVVSFDMKTPEAIFRFVSQKFYQTDLRGCRAFLSIDAEEIARLPPCDLGLLIRCIVLYKQGDRDFSAVAKKAVRLIKRGILIKTGVIAMTGNTTLAFPSPIHFDLTLYNVLHRGVTLKQSVASFEGALKEMVLRMNPKLLKDTTPDGQNSYERQWQDECVQCFRFMSSKNVKTEVGREFDHRAYLDMYVNDGLQWGIELIRRGVGKRLEEHVDRFSETDGRYRKIPMRQHAVLNFTDEVPDQATLDMYDRVWHLVYNAMYTKVTVYRKDHTIDDWDLIGFQGRTEY